MSFDLESLIHLEQAFFDIGYSDGYTHGRAHGLIDGRALGREKGYSLWEEVGFYLGFARVWAAIEADVQSRTGGHARHLLELVAQFPRENPSHTCDGDVSQVNVVELLDKIRARYKALCATLGVRPRLRPADESTTLMTPEARRQGSNERNFLL